MDFRKKDWNFRRSLCELEFFELERMYMLLCEFIQIEHFPKMTQTYAEDKIYSMILKSTKLEVHRSIWIGNMNVDLFIPSVKSTSSETGRGIRGLAIEIDGPIHDVAFKMKKDQKKYETLHSLSIATVCIENSDRNSETVRTLISSIKTLSRMDSRARKRLMRNIYIATFLAHKDVILKYDWPRGKACLKLLGEL